MTTEINDPVAAFDVAHALEEWNRRGVPENDLITILRNDLEHCRESNQPASAMNIERMLAVLEV